ncbi:galactose oxidase [Gigaspora margarita]|uniref:Galactose oxidase n=2 Tax=Gigaspora margarita TaxID=4874 RepID=A0A8H4ALV7_GIGMA|nr:galactose oxidase [Gigaspora margarita]
MTLFNMNTFRKIHYMFLVSSLVFFIAASQNIPNPRYAQASALVNNKLYFFGGKLETNTVTNEVWYLDVESLSNATIHTWHQSPSMPVGYYYGTSCVSVTDNSTILLIGGISYTPNTPNLDFDAKVYIFNPNKPQWKSLKFINGSNNFVMRNNMQAVMNKYGQIFIYGGLNFTNNNSSNTVYNDMNLLLATDYNDILWSTPSVTYAPPTPFIQYTATLLSNGLIVYIGGIQETQAISATLMTTLKLFDTYYNSWSDQTISGDPIESRAGHSAVLAQNEIIIVYGGYSTKTNATSYNTVTPDVAVLNTTTWTWSTPYIFQAHAPPLLALHSAVLYENYMIIAFGLNVAQSTGLTPDTNLLSNDIYILDIQNYAWVIVIPANQSSEYNILQFAIGIGVGVAILIIFLSFSGYMCYSKYFNYQEVHYEYLVFQYSIHYES